MRRDHPGSRWQVPTTEVPATYDSHLIEREQRIRRMRQGRLLGDLLRLEAGHDGGAPAGGSASWVMRGRRSAERGEAVGALRCYREALRADDDSYPAWVGLWAVFKDLDDEARAERCLGVARRLLRRAPQVSASL